MAVIYGWTYAEFHANIGWERGTLTEYEFWEAYWALQVNSYIFEDAGVLLTDADEILEIQTLINRMMTLTNLYLKAESNETPMQSGFYANPGFPEFRGSPDDNNGNGSEDYLILNKYRQKNSESEARADSIRIGIDPGSIKFRRDRLYMR